ncbi:SDR family oxidoreductase [soil metagenome]
MLAGLFEMGLLDGKVAIVTGAGGGLGRAYARLFAKEGAKVLVNDVGGARDGHDAAAGVAHPADVVVKEIRESGGSAEANRDSVATAAGAAAIVKAAQDAFGRVDILVNNAGILRDKTLLKTSEEDFDAVVAVHLRGSFLVGQAFARALVAQGEGGKIINTTSVSGMLGNFGQSSYAAAKAGIYGLTRTMSIELQKHKIQVNAIAPIAKTRMTEDLPMFAGKESLTPEHVAPAALFLASSLSGDKTGHVLAVAGARMYAFKVFETAGKFKDAASGESDVWTAEEIRDHWEALVK